MKKIYKYELSFDNYFELYLPQYVKPLHVGVQNGKPMLWAEVDPDNTTIKYEIHCIKDYDEVLAGPEYIGTIQLFGFVWHYYII